MPSFKEEYSFEERLAEATRIKQKYPDRIPVIVEIANNNSFFSRSDNLPQIPKNKYLVPSDLTVGQFMFTIRKSMKLRPETAIFCFINDQIPPTSALMSEVYEEHVEPCLFLFMTLSSENVFGLD